MIIIGIKSYVKWDVKFGSLSNINIWKVDEEEEYVVYSSLFVYILMVLRSIILSITNTYFSATRELYEN